MKQTLCMISSCPDTLKRIAGGNSESSTTESHREGSLNISDTTEKSDVGSK